MSVRPDSASDPRDQPESPWLRRSEWSQRRVSARRAGAVSYSFAILWNTLILLMLGVVFLSPTGNKTAALLGLAPFAVAGLVLLSSAVRSTLRQRRFGQSTFEIETLPGVIGGQLRGAVQVSGLKTPPAAGFDVLLRSEGHAVFDAKSLEIGRGRVSGHRSWTLWRDDYNAEGQSEGGAVSVPVLFDIPSSSRETSRDSPFPYEDDSAGTGEWVEWSLLVNASLRGADCMIEFPVPVFDVGETSATHHATFEKRPLHGTGAEPRFVESPDGSSAVELPPPQGALLLGGCLLTMALSIVLVVLQPAYWGVAASVFAGVTLIGALAVLGLLATPRRMNSRRGQLTILYGGYGLTRQVQLQLADVETVALETVREAGHGGRPRVYLELASGRRIEIDPRLSGHGAVERFGSELCERLGLPELTVRGPEQR